MGVVRWNGCGCVTVVDRVSASFLLKRNCGGLGKSEGNFKFSSEANKQTEIESVEGVE